MNPLSPIEAARQRHHLAEVAARTGISILRSAGGAVTVRCPMPSHGHPDRTPSLRLYLNDDMWYCFGCSTHAGDVVQWVQQTEGVGWRKAIEILDSGRALTNAWPLVAGKHDRDDCPRADFEGPEVDRTPVGRIQEAVEAAWACCTTGPLHGRAVAYLAGRHIDVNALEAYTGRLEVGHTPTHGPGVVRRLLSDGFSAEELVDAGLAHRRPDGRLTDFYKERVLVPVRDRGGHLAGLIGRNIGDPRWPKYKNPPRTALYNKSVNLYQPLPPPTGPAGRAVIVEGTLDALAIAVAAIRTGRARQFCPITQSGRELSTLQLRYVLAMHPAPPIAAFDGDGPGRASNGRLARAAAMVGRKTVIAELPYGEDPASWIARRGPEVLSRLVQEGSPGPTGRFQTEDWLDAGGPIL